MALTPHNPERPPSGAGLTLQQLHSDWTLESFKIGPIDGELSLWRDGSSGTLHYGTDGRMVVDIRGDRLPSEDEDRLANILWYSGTYSLDPDGCTVRHQVERASDADRVGKEMVRRATLKGDVLVLSGETGDQRFELAWKRAHRK